MELENACIFCDIVAGQAPASIVYEDEQIVAFMDIRPVTPGHLLIIPKRHATYLAELDEGAGAHLFRITLQLAAAVRVAGVHCDGVNLFLADGEVAGQEIFHVHMHIIPRFAGDGFIVTAMWPTPPSRTELDAVAGQIQQAHRKPHPKE